MTGTGPERTGDLISDSIERRMNRREAIDHLQAQGFDVIERSWALGDTIIVRVLPSQIGEIRMFGFAEYLYPLEDGAWGITGASEGTAGTTHRSLMEAVNVIATKARAVLA